MSVNEVEANRPIKESQMEVELSRAWTVVGFLDELSISLSLELEPIMIPKSPPEIKEDAEKTSEELAPRARNIRELTQKMELVVERLKHISKYSEA